MQPAKKSGPLLGKLIGIAKFLAAIAVSVGAFLFKQHMEREDEKHRETMRSLEESKRSIEAIEHELRDIEQRR